MTFYAITGTPAEAAAAEGCRCRPGRALNVQERMIFTGRSSKSLGKVMFIPSCLT